MIIVIVSLLGRGTLVVKVENRGKKDNKQKFQGEANRGKYFKLGMKRIGVGNIINRIC